MMAVTHVLLGLLLAAPVAVVAPAYATAAGVGAVVGAIVPDFDLFVGVHRKTLHYPVAGPIVGVVAGIVALLSPSGTTVAVALALLSAGVHAASDVLGAGEELRPWERTNPYAVYDHVNGRWLRARYLVPYDGAPRDLLVCLVAAVPALLVFQGPFRWLLAGLLAVAVAYTAVRRRLVPHVEALLE
jgi:hypothetical protein